MKSRGALIPAGRRAFTFLEIMLVVVIIGILLGIVGPRLVGQRKKAKITATKAQMDVLANALARYEMDVGDFPSESQGLKALMEKPSDVPEEDWEGPYLNDPKGLKDAWNEPFIYKFPSEHGKDYDLMSKGNDRQEGTEDDIKNWSDEEEE
ncbi:MAG: type II secretion system major pseudopilin GspG [Candidatus Sumerlaeia bacterium]